VHVGIFLTSVFYEYAITNIVFNDFCARILGVIGHCILLVIEEQIHDQ
jgi:hypothetical protein